jgi:DNA/RNA endonuclease G (NUC1)
LNALKQTFRLPAFLATLTIHFLLVVHCRALIGTQYQMQLGNPSNASSDTNNHTHFLIQRTVEALDYNDSLGEPNWACWDLTSADVGSSGRSSFGTDTSLPSTFYRVTTGDYSNSGYDRGHMCPSADRTDASTNNSLVFLMSNIVPQTSANNQTVWANFESYCRSLAQSGNELLIICGPGGFNGSRIQPSGKVAIPSFVWKVVVVVPLGSGMATNRITESTRVITIKVPNTDSVSSVWQNYVTSASQIQADTGLTFFTALPSNIAAALRTKVDGQTSLPPGVDLTVSSTHPGDFTQGDTNVVYTIVVNNLGESPSSGALTVTNFLPSGLTATAITGPGWNANLSNLTCSRNDSLPGGTNFPPIYLTVNVASNAAALVTNIVTIAGGNDAVSSNNVDFDVTVIDSPTVPNTNAPVVLVGFDVSGQTNYGVSPLLSSTNAAGIVTSGLTRGSGVGLTGTAAGRAWGGNNFTSTSAASAIASNQFFTFTVTAQSGQVSYSSISRFDYRRSSTGPANGLLQYQIGSGSFLDASSFSYPSNTSAGGSLSIDLSSITPLRNIGAGTNVTFRIVNWGATSSGGTWYVYDVVNNTGADLIIEGAITRFTERPNLTYGHIINGTFSFILTGASGLSYLVESTTNMVNWTGLGTFSNATGQISITDTNDLKVMQVYRASVVY